MAAFYGPQPVSWKPTTRRQFLKIVHKMDIIRTKRDFMPNTNFKYRFDRDHDTEFEIEFTLREWMLGKPQGLKWVDGTLSPVNNYDTLSDLSDRNPREPLPRGEYQWDRRDRFAGKIEYHRMPAQWLVEGIVLSGRLGVISPSMERHAKSVLSCNIAVAMACGTPWPILAGKDKRTRKPQTWDDEYSAKDRTSVFFGKSTHTPLGNINMDGRVLYLAGDLEVVQENISAALSGRSKQEKEAFERNFVLAPIGSSSMDTEQGISKIATEIGIASSKWSTVIKSWRAYEDDEPAYQVPEAVFYDPQVPATSLNVAEIVRETLGCAGNVGLTLRSISPTGEWSQVFWQGVNSNEKWGQKFSGSCDYREIEKIIEMQRDFYSTLDYDGLNAVYDTNDATYEKYDYDVPDIISKSMSRLLDYAKGGDSKNPWIKYAEGEDVPILFSARELWDTGGMRLMGSSAHKTTFVLVNIDETTIGKPDIQLGTGKNQTELVVYNEHFPSPFTLEKPLKIHLRSI